MQLLLCYWLNSNTRGKAIDRVPLPPPLYGAGSFSNSKLSWSSGFRPSAPSSARHEAPVRTAPPASSASDNHVIYLIFNELKITILIN